MEVVGEAGEARGRSNKLGREKRPQEQSWIQEKKL
jgi:hypothetical protein